MARKPKDTKISFPIHVLSGSPRREQLLSLCILLEMSTDIYPIYMYTPSTKLSSQARNSEITSPQYVANLFFLSH